VYEQKPVNYLFEVSLTNVSKLFDLIQPPIKHLFSKRKKEKRKQCELRNTTNESGRKHD
jgi:hypothetical protein